MSYPTKLKKKRFQGTNKSHGKNDSVHWYQDFFDNHYLDSYKELLNHFNPEKEVDFLLRAMNIPGGAKILDLCGGHGRHSIPLAKRGYEVTLLDLNKNFLKIAGMEAERKVIKLQTIQADMKDLNFENEFDGIINLFTSFGYLETEEDNVHVLRQVYGALKPGGKFLIDVINKKWILENYRERDWRKVDDLLVLVKRNFNEKTSRNKVRFIIIDTKNCKTYSTEQNIRLYNYPELESLFLKTGFKIVGRYGKMDGEEFDGKSMRIVLVGEKPLEK